MTQVCVIGTGYVGLVTAACLSYIGNSVIGVDTDRRKLELLKQGVSPIFEPGAEALMKSGIAQKRLRFSDDVRQAILASEVIFIAVGTPGLPDGRVDLSQIEAAGRNIGETLGQLGDGVLRVIATKSTVPVGTCLKLEEIIRQSAAALGHGETSAAPLPGVNRNGRFVVASNPEFLREGSAVGDYLYPHRIIIGTSDERAIAVLSELYRPIVEQSFVLSDDLPARPYGLARVPLVTMDSRSAEMAKYAANAFLSIKIGFANEIANICEPAGADVTKVLHAVGLDRRIGPQYLSAGIGWGGSCLGKDVAALAQTAEEFGCQPALLRASLTTNCVQRLTVIQKLQSALGIVDGKTIGLLGLAFKPETDDLRDAPSLTIAHTLIQMGARVKVYDPVAMKSCRAEQPKLNVIYATDALDLAADCDAVVLVTEWDEFRRLDLKELRRVMAGAVLLDGRNIFEAQAARAAGLKYIGVGR
jgi:UDPglucose 6-dehydrogenase